MDDAHNHETRTIHNKLYNSNVKSNLKKVKKENEENMESEFCTVSSFKIVPHHTVSTESMSISCLRYGPAKL